MSKKDGLTTICMIHSVAVIVNPQHSSVTSFDDVIKLLSRKHSCLHASTDSNGKLMSLLVKSVLVSPCWSVRMSKGHGPKKTELNHLE